MLPRGYTPVGPQPQFKVSYSRFGNVHNDSDIRIPSPCLWKKKMVIL